MTITPTPPWGCAPLPVWRPWGSTGLVGGCWQESPSIASVSWVLGLGQAGGRAGAGSRGDCTTSVSCCLSPLCREGSCLPLPAGCALPRGQARLNPPSTAPAVRWLPASSSGWQLMLSLPRLPEAAPQSHGELPRCRAACPAGTPGQGRGGVGAGSCPRCEPPATCHCLCPSCCPPGAMPIFVPASLTIPGKLATEGQPRPPQGTAPPVQRRWVKQGH